MTREADGAARQAEAAEVRAAPVASRWAAQLAWARGDHYAGLAAALMRRWELVLVAAIVLMITAANMVWFSLETRPPHFDMAGHLEATLWYRDYLLGGNPFQFVSAYHYYPPFVYWVADGFYAFLGAHDWVAVLSNVVFLAILAFSVYGLGRTLWSRRVGLVATVFVVATPMMVSQFKEFQIDAPLTAMAAAGLYFLVRAREFADRRYSVLFGVVAGVGMLTKWTFALAIALPVLAAAAIAVVAAVRERSSFRAVNMAYSAIGAYIVVAPWYFHNWSTLRDGIRANTLNPQVYEDYNDPVVGSAESNLWYFWRLVDSQLYALPLLLLAAGLVLTVLHRDALRRNLYPLLLAVGTYAAFTLVAHKDTRYTLPMLGGIAVLAVWWLELLPRAYRIAAGAAVAAYAALAFYAVSFGIGAVPDVMSVRVGSHEVKLFGQHGYIIGRPSGERWYQEELFHEARRLHPEAPAIWHASPGTLWFNGSGMRYYSKLHGVPLAPSPEEATYLAVRGWGGWDPPEGFVRIRRVHLPDGSHLTTFRRTEA